MKRILVLALALLLVCGMTGCDIANSMTQKLVGEREAAQPENVQAATSGHEVSVMDNENYAMTITDLTSKYDEYVDSSYLTVSLQLENRSEDTSYTFDAEWALVNGVKINPALRETVTPGKKAITSVTLGWELPSSVIQNPVTDVDILFLVSDADSYDPIEKVLAHIYPCGKNNSKDYSYASKPTDTVLVDTPELRVVVTDCLRGEYDDYYIMLYIENRLDAKINLECSDVSVNGYMVDGMLWEYIEPGEGYYYPWWLYSFEEISGLFKDVEHLEFNFLAEYHTDDWKTVTIADDTFTLSP